jgi:NADP-dependent 3-hydroxy acid dehydrogenase YdfG
MQVLQQLLLHACTGGSAGIGKATALEFDANGATVAVLGRRLERLEAVVKQMKHGVAIVGDLTKEEDMKRAMTEAIDKMGGLDILINNGGVRGLVHALLLRPCMHHSSGADK